MIYFIASVAAGVIAGFVAANIPFGTAVIFLLLVLSAVFAGRFAISESFRNSPSSGAQFYFLVAIWITLFVFYEKPTGLDTLIPKMDLKQVPLSEVVKIWNDEVPNITFRCDDSIKDAEVNLTTITPISLSETIDFLEESIAADVTYEISKGSGSIASGPHLQVMITLEKNDPDEELEKPGKEEPEKKDREEEPGRADNEDALEEPYIYDANEAY